VYSSYVNKGSGSLSYVRFFLCIGGGLGATIQKLVLGAFYTLVPIRPRSRGERRSLRTFAVVPLRPGSLAFDPDTPRRLSTPLLTPFNSTQARTYRRGCRRSSGTGWRLSSSS
jgi:hypothetical protein